MWNLQQKFVKILWFPVGSPGSLQKIHHKYSLYKFVNKKPLTFFGIRYTMRKTVHDEELLSNRSPYPFWIGFLFALCLSLAWRLNRAAGRRNHESAWKCVLTSSERTVTFWSTDLKCQVANQTGSCITIWSTDRTRRIYVYSELEFSWACFHMRVMWMYVLLNRCRAGNTNKLSAGVC